MGGSAERATECDDAGAIMGSEPESFEEFFHAERDVLFRAMCVITGNRQEAEAIAQEAFARSGSVGTRWR